MLSSSEWCLEKAEACEQAGDVRGARAYTEMAHMWAKREDEKAKRTLCVCGKSPTGQCVGICSTGE